MVLQSNFSNVFFLLVEALCEGTQIGKFLWHHVIPPITVNISVAVESCVLEALSWSSPAVFSWKPLKAERDQRSHPNQNKLYIYLSIWSHDKSISIKLSMWQGYGKRSCKHPTLTPLTKSPVPAKGCDLVWAYLEEFIHTILHQTADRLNQGSPKSGGSARYNVKATW